MKQLVLFLFLLNICCVFIGILDLFSGFYIIGLLIVAINSYALYLNYPEVKRILKDE